MTTPTLALLLGSLALAGMATADVPRKAPFSRYTSLYTNSPFTSKPPPAEEGPANNPLDDYALIGISPIGGSGYRVTLLNKKSPEERIMVDSDDPKAEFKILGVTRKAGDPLGTVVSMSSGSMKGTVAFDEKLLTLAAPKVAPPPQPLMQNGQPVPPQAGQQQPPTDPNAARVPRPRVVPPPATPVAGQPSGQNSNTNANISNQRGQRGNRPDRRGNGN